MGTIDPYNTSRSEGTARRYRRKIKGSRKIASGIGLYSLRKRRVERRRVPYPKWPG